MEMKFFLTVPDLILGLRMISIIEHYCTTLSSESGLCKPDFSPNYSKP